MKFLVGIDWRKISKKFKKLLVFYSQTLPFFYSQTLPAVVMF